MVADFNLFNKEPGWKGEARGEGKATEGHGPLSHNHATASLPSPIPQPTMGHHDSGTCGGQAQPSRWLAWMGNEVRQLHGQQQVAKTPQQEYGQGAAGTLQEHLRWARGRRSGHRRDRSRHRQLESHRRCGQLLNHQRLR